tara:strand:+ start:339 stop:647 length:309 start_codon:yes stop_codon:yes gene_type:complete
MKITIIDRLGKIADYDFKENQKLRNLAAQNDLEGGHGMCGGFMECGTCHVIVEEKGCVCKKQEEQDCIDNYVFDATEYSRLACQIILDKTWDGAIIKIADSY